MAKTEKCPECGQMLDPRGFRFHRAAKHGVSMQQSKGAGVSSAPPIAADSPAIGARPAEKVPAIPPPTQAPAPAGSPAPKRSPFAMLGDLL